MVVDDLKVSTVVPILKENIDNEARVLTDEASHYRGLKKHFANHGYTSHHHGEYVSKEVRSVHTNTIESFFSDFKRCMKGVYQHCTHNHLNHFLAEFDFRYNTCKALEIDDEERAEMLLMGVIGKRLTYQTSSS